MNKSIKQLDANWLVHTLRRLKWPLLGLPLVGYGMDGARGVWIGLACLVGLWLGLGLINAWTGLRIRHFLMARKLLHAPCPHCMHQLEGRRVCMICQAELNPVAFVPGIRLVSHCSNCDKELDKGRGSERCFADACDVERDLGPFAERLGTFSLMIHRSGEELSWPEEWEIPPDDDHAGDRWCARGQRAALIRSVVDHGFGLGDLSAEARHALSNVWVQNGSNPGAVANLRALTETDQVKVFFEKDKLDDLRGAVGNTPFDQFICNTLQG